MKFSDQIGQELNNCFLSKILKNNIEILNMQGDDKVMCYYEKKILLLTQTFTSFAKLHFLHFFKFAKMLS